MSKTRQTRRKIVENHEKCRKSKKTVETNKIPTKMKEKQENTEKKIEKL